MQYNFNLMYIYLIFLYNCFEIIVFMLHYFVLITITKI